MNLSENSHSSLFGSFFATFANPLLAYFPKYVLRGGRKIDKKIFQKSNVANFRIDSCFKTNTPIKEDKPFYEKSQKQR